MSPADADRCDACGHVSFPSRLWCPACGCDQLTAVELDAGVVAGSTRRRGDVVLLDIHCAEGPRLTARAREDAELATGTAVSLYRGAEGELRARPAS
jgi:uncharacterized OB-fold protein